VQGPESKTQYCPKTKAKTKKKKKRKGQSPLVLMILKRISEKDRKSAYNLTMQRI
jgi:hypothetical protein